MKNGISVIIPTYNREQFIKKAIQSVLDQNYNGHLEIIISDDGSTDQTLTIAEAFKDRIIILKKPLTCKTQGVASTRNRGIKASTQPYISFLDSDDFYLPGHLNKMSKVFEKTTNLGFVFCKILAVKEKNGQELFKPWTHQKIFKNDIRNPVVSRTRIVHTNSFLFNRSVFDTVGVFDENYPNGEDSDLWMRISEKFQGSFANHFGAVYRIQHGNNQLTNNSQKTIRNNHTDIFKKAIERYYQLKINDPKRIFKLKHWLLICNYRQKSFVYYSRYVSLIMQYFFTFISHYIPLICYDLLEKKEKQQWKKMQTIL
jgi:glycosyltransferase involved in cell wall biosynthesis